MVFFFIWIATLFWNSEVVHAEEFQQLYRSTRTQGMGGAYTALADDPATSVFLNPAGLSGNEKYEFNLLDGNLEISDDFIKTYTEGASAFSKGLTLETLNLIVGKNYYVRGQVAPTLIMGPIGLGLISEYQAAIYAYNKSMPTILYGLQNTNGAVLSFGFPLSKIRKRKPQLNMGVGIKYLLRRGGFKEFGILELLSIDTEKMLEMGKFVPAIGLDLGLQHYMPLTESLSMRSSLVFKDTYANLNLDETTTLEVGTFTAGGALKWSSGIFGYSLAADYTHLAQVSGIDWRRKVHLGLELDTTLLQIWGGISQMQLCYGAGINLWLFKVQAASYGEPIGVSYDQSASRRYIVQALTKIPL